MKKKEKNVQTNKILNNGKIIMLDFKKVKKNIREN